MRRAAFGAGGPFAESVALPKDRDGFVRRECPECHRVFKVPGTHLEGRLVFERLSAQVGHANAHEAAWPAAQRHCPYCGARAGDERWFTAEQRAFLDKRAASFGQEVRYEQLSHVERTLAENPSPTFLPLRPARAGVALAPEPDDMRPVTLFCCREEVKVIESWSGPVRCFLCGTEHELGSGLLRERLSDIFG